MDHYEEGDLNAIFDVDNADNLVEVTFSIVAPIGFYVLGPDPVGTVSTQETLNGGFDFAGGFSLLLMNRLVMLQLIHI